QAGKGALPWDHPRQLGSIGVTGSSAANAAASAADLVIGVGTRLQDFTTGSRTLFPEARLFQINIQPVDAAKHGAEAVVGDAHTALEALALYLRGWRAPNADSHAGAIAAWTAEVEAATAPDPGDTMPSDARRSEEHTSELQSRENLVCR